VALLHPNGTFGLDSAYGHASALPMINLDRIEESDVAFGPATA
jgi:hypothetical protein